MQWFAEPKACAICSRIAHANNGYGPGIYKISKAPKIPDDTHPNCRCSISETWVDDSNERRRLSAAGALNNTNDPDMSKRYRHARMYYTELRNSKRSSLIQNMQQSSQLPESVVISALRHVLDSKYSLDNGAGTSIQHFYPDYDMAQSFQRLNEGDPTDYDIIMLQHEALEAQYMDDGMDYETAHIKTNKTYNYAAALLKAKKR
ncbi:hypothetical protein [Limosilactobacillus difficilis]|uniref:hypothetical protein n=1 Tax=Limosilactobacillus difficilis TaxID=2991838 RepID=UPI0024B9D9CA|nr:hypothetical protein [Limosilactobacillus difficilis]